MQMEDRVLSRSRCSSQKPYGCRRLVVPGAERVLEEPGLLSHPNGPEQSQGKQTACTAELGTLHLLPATGPHGNRGNNLPPD